MKQFDREQYLAEIRADIAAQRHTLTNLVDEVHAAFRAAGGTSEEYTRSQFFQGVLFRAIQTLPDGTAEKRTAFKVALIFMRGLLQHYKDMAKDPEWKAAHDVRQP